MSLVSGKGSAVLAIIFTLVGIVFLLDIPNINDLGLGIISPRLFPYIISILLIASGTLLTIVEVVRGKRVGGQEPKDIGVRRLTLKTIIKPSITVVSVVAYVFTLRYLGYVIGTSTLLLIVSLLIKPKLVDAILISLVCSLGTFLLFNIILKVVLPAGILVR